MDNTGEPLQSAKPQPHLEELVSSLDEIASENFSFPWEADTLAIIRDLLLAPDDDTNAAKSAVQRAQEYYRIKFFPPDDPFYLETPGHGADDIVGCLVQYVFQLVHAVPFEDVRQQRLVDFLLELKAATTGEFDPKDPKLVVDGDLLGMHPRDSWNSYHIIAGASRERCNGPVNMHAFLASIMAAGLLPDHCHWAVVDITEALDGHQDTDEASPVVLQSRASIAAHYILRAGSLLVELARNPTDGATRERYPLNEAKWRSWAAKFKQLAETTSPDAPWDLKGNAGKAYERMVELWPNLVEEGDASSREIGEKVEDEETD